MRAKTAKNKKTSVKSNYPYQDQLLKDRDGEKWYDIPFLDGAYQISNYGRVKSLRRWVQVSMRIGYWLDEKILQPRVSMQIVSKGKRKLYRLSITISFEGKHYTVGIARMVYYVFVGTFDLKDRRLVVSCKDENPFNITPENLVLTSPSVNIIRAYKEKRRPRDSFGNIARPVNQFDLRGEWICTYPSLAQASNSTGISSSHISESLKRRSTYAGGYIWRYGSKGKKINIPAPVQKKLASDFLHSQIVTQYDLAGNKIREHLNLKAAAKAAKVQVNQVRSVILGTRLSAARCYWVLGKGADKISVFQFEEKLRQSKEKICRPISRYDLHGNKIMTYGSIAEAARALGTSPMTISTSLRNEYKSITSESVWAYGEGPARVNVDSSVQRRLYIQNLYQQHVTQYDRQGKRIAQFTSLRAAAKAVKGQAHTLAAAVEGKYLTFKGHFWRLGQGEAQINVKEDNMALQSRLRKISKPVALYDVSGRKVNEYESISAAARATGTSESQIRKVASGKNKKAKGFSWRFKE
jgi:hypothetical protein